MELILALFQEMSRMIGSRTPSPVARAEPRHDHIAVPITTCER